MKTTAPTKLFTPSLITSVSKNGSSLRFTYGNGTFEDINLITLANALQLDIEKDYNEQIEKNTTTFIRINPVTLKDGDIKIAGNNATMFIDSEIQIT